MHPAQTVKLLQLKLLQKYAMQIYIKVNILQRYSRKLLNQTRLHTEKVFFCVDDLHNDDDDETQVQYISLVLTSNSLDY